MSFLHPEALYFMLVPLMILFGFLLSQKESQDNLNKKLVIQLINCIKMIYT